MSKGKNARDAAWIEAKQKCRLNDETIRMAKELGMTPKTLIKNIPSKSEMWKASVSDWVRDLHDKRFNRSG
ncbi:MAG: hypothetical protein Q7T82_08600 [Armatimonadota bacterium]|nr:hypothetical protein [Armatimonadota bacterium]